MSNNRIKRTEKKPLPEGEVQTTRIELTVQNLEVTKVRLLASIDKKLTELLEIAKKNG